MKNEIWKDIKGYEGLYKISNFGRVKSFKHSTPKILQPFKVSCPTLSNPNNYRLCIGLQKRKVINGKIIFIKKDKKVHRLVAEAFLKNFKPKLLVRKKNKNPDENDCSNLVPKKSLGIEVIKLNKSGVRIKVFSSILEAKASNTRASQSGIRLCSAGLQKQSGGYLWKCKK